MRGGLRGDEWVGCLQSVTERSSCFFTESACCARLLGAQVPSFFNSLGFVIPERKEVADFLQVRQHPGHALATGRTLGKGMKWSRSARGVV